MKPDENQLPKISKHQTFESTIQKVPPFPLEPVTLPIEVVMAINRDLTLLASFAANVCGVDYFKLAPTDLVAYTKKSLGA